MIIVTIHLHNLPFVIQNVNFNIKGLQVSFSIYLNISFGLIIKNSTTLILAFLSLKIIFSISTKNLLQNKLKAILQTEAHIGVIRRVSVLR